MSDNSLSKNNNSYDTSTIKELIEEGVIAREYGDYVKGERLLTDSLEQSKDVNNDSLIIESSDQLSIQYRLLSGRHAREGEFELAKDYSNKALSTYKDLENRGLLDPEHFSTQRNYSHALLYSGYIDWAIVELQKSLSVQPEDALRGDEMCHLASAYCDVKALDIEKASELVSTGIKLLQENEGRPVALTYGLMTKATVLSKRGSTGEATSTLNKALGVSIANNLKVREEEIQYLLSKAPSGINVLDAVSGLLRNERRHEIPR